MKIIVFDCETTGLPYIKRLEDTPSVLELWPHIIQLSYIIYNIDTNNIEKISNNYIKLPNNIKISIDSIKIHSLTNEFIQENGIIIDNILLNFIEDLHNVDLVIGHNIEFDINMIKVELFRLLNNIKLEIKLLKNNTSIPELEPELETELETELSIKNKKENVIRAINYICNIKNIFCTCKEYTKFCRLEKINKYGEKYYKFPKLTELYKKIFDCEPDNMHDSLFDVLAVGCGGKARDGKYRRLSVLAAIKSILQ